MAKGRTITTKYGTKINVEGLSPEQITKVRNVAESKGAYGTKGAALAKQFRKNAINVGRPTPQTGGPLQIGTQPPATGGPLYIDPNSGDYDPNAVLSQAPAIYSTGDFQSEVQKAQDANYQYLTKNLGQQKAQEMEAMKQELANRGIPLDMTPTSAYGSAIKSLEDKYTQLDQDARNQAIMAGNQTLTAQSGVNLAGREAFLQGIMGIGGQQADMYGLQQDRAFRERQLDWQTKQAQKDRALQLRLARMRSSGGGGGGGGDAGPIIGGMAPGFGV